MEHWGFWEWLLAIIVVIAVFAVVRNLRDIARYLRIRSM